jgi:hypothetical protein
MEKLLTKYYPLHGLRSIIAMSSWNADALCAKNENKAYRDFFFQDEDEDEDEVKVKFAQSICRKCPVKKQCLKSALDNKEVWGVWGGRTQEELRNTLSLNEDGQEVRRSREGIAPVCLSCDAPTEALVVGEVNVPGGGRWATTKTITCSECSFQWSGRSSANAIESYLSIRKRTIQQEEPQ